MSGSQSQWTQHPLYPGGEPERLDTREVSSPVVVKSLVIPYGATVATVTGALSGMAPTCPLGYGSGVTPLSLRQSHEAETAFGTTTP